MKLLKPPPATITTQIRQKQSGEQGKIVGYFLVLNNTMTAYGPFIKRLRYDFWKKQFEQQVITIEVGSTSAHDKWVPLYEHMVVVGKIETNTDFKELTPIDVKFDGWAETD